MASELGYSSTLWLFTPKLCYCCFHDENRVIVNLAKKLKIITRWEPSQKGALVGGRHLKEGGAFFKVRKLLIRNFKTLLFVFSNNSK